jgi:hypothetical protein
VSALGALVSDNSNSDQPRSRARQRPSKDGRPIRREPNGRHQRRSRQGPTTHGNPYVVMHRLYDHWGDLKRMGVNEDFGTVIGRLYVLEILTEREATAARIYATVMGRFDRYHGTPNRNAKAPAYERGSRGRDDEIERHERNGTLNEYERRANRARKAYNKLVNWIPTDDSRRLLDEVCILDVYPIDSKVQKNVATLLGVVATKFGLKPGKDK